MKVYDKHMKAYVFRPDGNGELYDTLTLDMFDDDVDRFHNVITDYRMRGFRVSIQFLGKEVISA